MKIIIVCHMSVPHYWQQANILSHTFIVQRKNHKNFPGIPQHFEAILQRKDGHWGDIYMHFLSGSTSLAITSPTLFALGYRTCAAFLENIKHQKSQILWGKIWKWVLYFFKKPHAMPACLRLVWVGWVSQSCWSVQGFPDTKQCIELSCNVRGSFQMKWIQGLIPVQ